MTTFFVNAGMPGVEAVNCAGRSLNMWDSVELGGIELMVEEEDTVIFGAWHESYVVPLRRLKCKKARLVTSSLSQMELSFNGIELPWLEQDFKFLEKGVLDYILFGCQNAYEYHRIRNNGVKYFPYPIRFAPKFVDWEVKEDTVGIFMGGARKNSINQVCAAELASRKRPVEFITNFGKNPRWIPDDEYKEILQEIKATLFVSHAESFGYTAIDALEAGCLPIVSPCIRRNLGLEPWLRIHNPDSAIEISEKIVEVVEMDEENYMLALEENRARIHRLAGKNNIALKKLLKSL